MSKMRTIHNRRKRRTAKQGAGKSAHKSHHGRTGSVRAKHLASRQPEAPPP